MLRSFRLLPSCLLVLLLSSLGVVTRATEPLQKRSPNVVIVYGDDVGYGDVGVYGSEKIPTPNLDRLAARGLVFTDGHCPAATCSPSRYSMLTGRFAFRNGVRILGPTSPLCIDTERFTLADLFQKAGYTTGVVGKWHLGLGAKDKKPGYWNGEVKPGPLEIGFDTSFLLPNTNDRVPCVYLDGHRVVGLDPADPIYIGEKLDPRSTEYPDGRKTPEAMTYYPSSHGHNHSVIHGIGRIGVQFGGKAALWNDETMADVFVEKAGEFITKNREKPFFLFFSSQDIHVPRTPHPRFHGKSELGYRGDAMVQLDWATGALMAKLEEHGLTENTIFIFSSDNGPVYDDGYQDGTTVKTSTAEVDRGHDGSGPYRGGKYQIYEGGTRVPFIVSWPARIRPGTSNALVTQTDFLATFAKLLGVELSGDVAIDSQETLAALLGESPEGNAYILEEARGVALRHGNWKLIVEPPRNRRQAADGKRGPVLKLYDLSKDIGETTNVAAEHPGRVERLHAFVKELQAGKGMREVVKSRNKD